MSLNKVELKLKVTYKKYEMNKNKYSYTGSEESKQLFYDSFEAFQIVLNEYLAIWLFNHLEYGKTTLFKALLTQNKKTLKNDLLNKLISKWERTTQSQQRI